MITRSEAEAIAEGLVFVEHRPLCGLVWIVKIGVGIDQYNLMYDTSAVANTLAARIKEAIVDGIMQAAKLDQYIH